MRPTLDCTLMGRRPRSVGTDRCRKNYRSVWHGLRYAASGMFRPAAGWGDLPQRFRWKTDSPYRRQPFAGGWLRCNRLRRDRRTADVVIIGSRGSLHPRRRADVRYLGTHRKGRKQAERPYDDANGFLRELTDDLTAIRDDREISGSGELYDTMSGAKCC